MQSRRDQVEAHSHLLSRLTGAMVRADPDGVEPPNRRDSRAMFGGLLVGLLAVGGVAAWALLFGSGSTAWKQAGTLIVVKDSGSRYMLLDGTLHPVLNIASARLLTGTEMKTASVPTSRLKGVPRGAPIGITGAPDMLPQTPLLNKGVWRSCMVAPDDRAVVRPPGADVLPGTVMQISTPAAAARYGGGDAVLVSAKAREYLLWQGQRLAIEREWAGDVLGFGGVKPVPVTAQWLDLLPPGPAIAPAPMDRAGKPGPTVAGERALIGQIFRSDPGGGQVTHYLALPRGLAPMTATEYAMASAEPKMPAERTISAADLARAKRTEMPRPGGQLPERPPAVRQPGPGESICLEYPGVEGAPTVDVVRQGLTAKERRATVDASGNPVVSVSVTPGGGALVGTDPAAPLKDQPQLLIDDNGIVYPLADGARDVLGYAAEQAVVVPSDWVVPLPRGPLLSRAGGG
jgi:type VII secretion protein EccB